MHFISREVEALVLGVGVAQRVLDAISRQGAPPSRSAKGCTKPMDRRPRSLAVSLPNPT